MNIVVRSGPVHAALARISEVHEIKRYNCKSGVFGGGVEPATGAEQRLKIEKCGS